MKYKLKMITTNKKRTKENKQTHQIKTKQKNNKKKTKQNKKKTTTKNING